MILDCGLAVIPGKTPVHQMRFYFDRCLRVFKEDEVKDSSLRKVS